MILEGGILRSLRAAGAGAVLCSLFACMGGTGTDTENGITISARVVDSSGEPVANIELQVLDLTASAASPSQNPLVDTSAVLKSSNNGVVVLELKKSGLYIAQGRRGDSVVFADTLRAVKLPSGPSNPGLGTPEFVVENPIKATGRVKLLSGFSADSGRVMIQGTKLQSGLANDGTYMLGWLPPSMEKLTLNAGYRAKASNTRFVKVIQEGTGWRVLMGGDGRCLTSASLATTLSPTAGTGALTDLATQARIAGLSCRGSTGSQVRVIQTDASGTAITTLGDFVVADAAAQIPDSAAVPIACIRAGTAGSSRASLKLGAGQIVVNDIIRGGTCPAE